MDKNDLEARSVQFVRSVYDILYKEDEYYDPNKEWDSDTLDSVAAELHMFVPRPPSLEEQAVQKSAERVLKSVTIQVIHLDTFLDADTIWRFCRRNALFERVEGKKEVIINCSDELLAAAEESLKESLIPNDFIDLLRQAAIEGKEDPSKRLLLILR